MKSEKFKFVEKCLYDYPKNCAKVDVLRLDLEVLRKNGDVKAQSYDNDSRGSEGGHSDPVWSFVEQVERLEKQIFKLERITTPITRLTRELKMSKGTRKADLLQVLELYYFEDATSKESEDELHLDRKTLFRRRKYLVSLAGEYLGV